MRLSLGVTTSRLKRGGLPTGYGAIPGPDGWWHGSNQPAQLQPESRRLTDAWNWG